MEAITNTTNEQKCNQNMVDAMPALYAFALQQQVPVSDTFCWHTVVLVQFVYTHASICMGHIFIDHCHHEINCLREIFSYSIQL